MDAEARLQTYSSRVDKRLDELLTLPEPVPHELVAAMRYAALSPGKRLRPALAMASAQAVGSEPESALDAGCAIELVHCFSLIHDDLPAIDDDSLRRGRPTVHIQFGEAVAILAGDALFSLAFEILASAQPEPGRCLKAVFALARASGPAGLVGGEMADILAEGKQANPSDVRSIHERKTAALIEASCGIGALMGGADEAQLAALERFGRHAGLAFQISDDLLNELSTAAALGKSVGSDREKHKATYPAAFGLDDSRRIAEDEVRQSLEALQIFGNEANDLRLFARYVVERLR